MLAEDIKTIVHRDVEEAWNKGNLDVLDESYATDFILHQPPFPDVEGLEVYKQQIVDSRNTFSDLHLSIDEIIIEGDKVAVQWTFQGVHTGESVQLHIPPTGKQVTIKGCNMGRIVDGKIVELWFFADNLGFLQQLGVAPAWEPVG